MSDSGVGASGRTISADLLIELAAEFRIARPDRGLLEESLALFDSFWRGQGYVRFRTTDQATRPQLSYTFLGRPARVVPDEVRALRRASRRAHPPRDDNEERLEKLAAGLEQVFGALWLGSDFEVDRGLVKDYWIFQYGLGVEELTRGSLAPLLPPGVQARRDLLATRLPGPIVLVALNYQAGAASLYALADDVAGMGSIAKELFSSVTDEHVGGFLAELGALGHDAPRNVAYTFGFGSNDVARTACYVSDVVARSGLEDDLTAAMRTHPKLRPLLRLLQRLREALPGRRFDTLLGWSFGGPQGSYRKFEASYGSTDIYR